LPEEKAKSYILIKVYFIEGYAMTPIGEVNALLDLAKRALLDWLTRESPTGRRKLKALELVAEASQCLHVACINLEDYEVVD
jgi:hypothetical protein